MRGLVLMVLLVFSTLGHTADAQQPLPELGTQVPPAEIVPLTPDLEPLRLLLGTWDASGGGKPGASTGEFTFESQAGGHAVLRRNESATPEGRHADVMLIHSEGQTGMTAVYLDSEGHVIHYAVTAPDPKTVVFLSEPAGGGPGFRLSYHLNEGGVLATKFEIAAPGSSEFSTYLEGTAKRK